MKAWWETLTPMWRESICIVAFGLPISYLLYIVLGVSALALGVQVDTIGYGTGWTAMFVLAALLGAGIGEKLAARMERRRVSAEGKERSDP